MKAEERFAEAIAGKIVDVCKTPDEIMKWGSYANCLHTYSSGFEEAVDTISTLEYGKNVDEKTKNVLLKLEDIFHEIKDLIREEWHESNPNMVIKEARNEIKW